MKSALTILVLTTAFGFAAKSASAAPVITLSAPAAGMVVQDSLTITGSVTSPYLINSAHAQVGGAGVDLTINSKAISGTLDISSVALGPVTLDVTATDAVNEAGSTSVSFIHDHPPVLNVATPDGFVANPGVRLQASCSDPDPYGCVSISVYGITVNGTTLDQTVTPTETGPLRLVFTATDSQGLTTTLSRMGYVPAPPVPNEVGHGDGPILDFDATRILFATDYSLFIRPRSVGPDTVIGPGGVTAAKLTSKGAVWPGGELSLIHI